MFTVQITYKSGKVEITEIKASEYTMALVSLVDEGRIRAIKILSFS